MRRVLAGGVGAVVATDAIARDVGVIEVGRNPRVGRVAVITVFATRYVRRVLAGCCVAIVAGAAGPEYLGVVDRVSRRKCYVVVTVLAYIARVDMRGVLSRCLHAIVTIDAVSGDVCVVEIGGRPCKRRVAVAAVVAARNVGRMFAGRRIAVVTAIAGSQNLRVIDSKYRRPGCAPVAILAGIRSAYVCGVLPGCVSAVVTTEAISGDVCVIEDGRKPQCAGVAIVALVTGNNVPGRFACCEGAVVAGSTTPGDGRVVHDRDRAPGRSCVAALA